MFILLAQLFGYLEDFLGRRQDRNTLRHICKVTRQVALCHTQAEWEELGKEVTRCKQLLKYRRVPEMDNLQKVYNRKGIEIGIKLRYKPTQTSTKRRW